MGTHTDFPGFPLAAVQFYADRLQNNERPWFEAHKADYQKYVLEPGETFVTVLNT